MRFGHAGSWAVVATATLAATILLPGGSAAAATVIVDNTTAGQFTASANWATSAWSGQKYGADYRYTTPDTTASDPAWYRMDIPSAGSYQVEVWYPADAGYNNATPFVVATASGNQTINVNQRAN